MTAPVVPERPTPPATASGRAAAPTIEILDELGRGSRTVTHRVRRRGELLAMKVSRGPVGTDEDAERAFRREAALVACVDHPHVVGVHEVGRADGAAYMLMDLVEGSSLTELLASGPLPLDALLRLGIDVARVLAATHDAGIVHRDIKPDNLVVDASGRTVVLDFGLAARFGATFDGCAAGTVLYCAPEQAGMLHRPLDGRADLYALGAVLHECATGEPPYVSSEVGELLRLHASAPVPDLADRRPDLPEELTAVITALLAKDPDDRGGDAADLAERLVRLAHAGGVADVAPHRPRARRGERLVGRDVELGELAERWDAARAGSGGVALVVGPPGAGKSRLVRELTGDLADQGVLVLRGKSDAGAPVPLGPLREAVDRHVDEVWHLPPSERSAAVAGLVEAAGPAAPLLRRLSASLGELLAAPEPVDDDTAQPFTAAVAGFLAELARRAGGAVLALDDVQWLDDSTRRILQQLAIDLADTPLLVLATARDDAASSRPVAALRNALEPVLDTTVVLDPLPPTAVAELAADLTGVHLEPTAAASLTALTGGNPFAVREYLPAVIDAGLLRPAWGAWLLDVDGLATLDLPADAAALILTRLDGLDPESRRILAVAAVLGGTFEPGLVAEVTGLEPARVLGVIAAARWRHLLERNPDGSVRFLHDRIREALLDHVDEEGRRSVHRRTADVLEARGADDRSSVYALARHARLGDAGDDRLRTFRTGTDAGRLALADHTPDEALVFLTAAAEAGEAAGVELDAGFLQLLGTAQHRSGRCHDAVATLERARAASDDRFERARILGAIARVHDSTWSTSDQIATVEEALQELGRPLPRNPVLLVVSTIVLVIAAQVVRLTRLGYGRVQEERRERYRLLLSLYDAAALAHARNIRPTASLVYTLRSLYLANRVGPGPERTRLDIGAAHLALAIGITPAARRSTARAQAAAAASGDPRLVAYVDWLAALDRCFFGLDNGEQVRRTFVERARWLEIGQAGDLLLVLIWQALLRGDTADAEATFARRSALVNASGQTGRITLHATEACLFALQGRAGEAAHHVQLMRESAGPDILPWERVDIAFAAMFLAVEQGELGEAFDHAVEEFDRLGVDPLMLVPAELGLYVCRAAGRVEQARAARGDDRAARLASARAAVRVLRRAARTPLLRAHHRVLRAALHEVAGDPEAALRALDAAEPVLRRADAPSVAYEAARLRALALRQLGTDGEADRQGRLALSIAVEHRWPHRARRITAELGLDLGVNGTGSFVRASGGLALDRYRQRLDALEQVGIAASRVLDPTRLAGLALDEIIGILGAERAILFLVQEDPPRLAPAVGRDARGSDLQRLTGYSATLVERVRQSQEAVVVTGTEEGAALGAESAVLHGLRSIMVAPLQLEGRLLGVVYLDSRVAKGVFTADDVGILTAITGHIAVALETARAAQLELAVTAATQQRDLAETLRAALAEVSGTLEPEEVLRRLLAIVLGLAPGGRAWLARPDDTGSTVQVLAAGPDPDGDELAVRFEQATVVPDETLADLLEATEPLVGEQDCPAPELGDGAAQASSWLAVPLTTRGERCGVLVLTAETPDAFSGGQVEIGAALVDQGMIAYENARLFAQVEELATIDDLTGVANRRHFFELAERELAVARRHGHPLAAVMIDIDNFKAVNDRHGHQVGDEILRAVAGRLRDLGRTYDLIGRYGGEEFALVLGGEEDAVGTAERLRAAVAAEPVETSAGPIEVTISIGVARRCPTQLCAGLADLLARADESLYEAKRAGRNLVRVADTSA